MIIRDRILGDINNGVQDMVVDAVVDKQSDLPAQNAVTNFNIVTPSTCHCVQESTDWMMDSNGNWYKQRSSGGGGGFDPDDYYTTTEIDNMLDDYYTSAQVDALLPDMTDYYTKTEVDNLIPSMTNYYTKSEVDALIPDMTLYYTSSETDSAISTALGNYYTKTQVDNLLPDMTLYYTSSQTDSAISTALSGYYTSAQVDSAISTALAGYYTSAQVDSLLGSYYTSAQTDSAISSYWTTNIANYYTKSEVDALIPTVPSTYNADDIVYDNATSGLTATDVQDAIDEVVASIPSIPSTYDADDITYDNTTSGLTATNVQDAIDELAQGGGGGGGGIDDIQFTVGKNKLPIRLGQIYSSRTSAQASSNYPSSGTIYWNGSSFTISLSKGTASNISASNDRGILCNVLRLKPNTQYKAIGFTGSTNFADSSGAPTNAYCATIYGLTEAQASSQYLPTSGTSMPDGTKLLRINGDSAQTFTTTSTGLITIRLSWWISNTSYSTSFSPMIIEATEADTSYEPFELSVNQTTTTLTGTAASPIYPYHLTDAGWYKIKGDHYEFTQSTYNYNSTELVRVIDFGGMKVLINFSPTGIQMKQMYPAIIPTWALGNNGRTPWNYLTNTTLPTLPA